MDEYKAILKAMLDKQEAQVLANDRYAEIHRERHSSHNDYAEGLRDGLQLAYDRLCKMHPTV